jgi:hypothetical protein
MEEPTAYFPSMRQILHRNRRLQQFLLAAGTCLSSRCLARVGRYTDGPTESAQTKGRVQQLFHCCLCIRCHDNFFTEPLPNNVHIQAHRLIWGIYEVSCWEGLKCYDMHAKFYKDWLRYSEVDVGEVSQTHRQHGDLISLLLFISCKKNRLKRFYNGERKLWNFAGLSCNSYRLSTLNTLHDFMLHKRSPSQRAREQPSVSNKVRLSLDSVRNK